METEGDKFKRKYPNAFPLLPQGEGPHHGGKGVETLPSEKRRGDYFGRCQEVGFQVRLQ